ncbi:MAG: HAD family hydrolase [Myxococcales bacterium]|nr:HAD family hydrolase [Myxococcales bacterium]
MSARAAIFDRDGVLTRFDLAPLRARLAAHGLSLESMMGAWEPWYRSQTLPKNRQEESQFIEAFLDAYCESHNLSADARDELVSFDYAALVRPFDDARPALAWARARGLRIAVLSNFPLVRLDESLVAAGLRDLVDAAFAAPVIGFSKPDRRAYLHVAAALEVAPERCAMVDDELDCVRGAEAVGMRAWLLDRRDAPPPALSGLDEFCSELEGLL